MLNKSSRNVIKEVLLIDAVYVFILGIIGSWLNLIKSWYDMLMDAFGYLIVFISVISSTVTLLSKHLKLEQTWSLLLEVPTCGLYCKL